MIEGNSGREPDPKSAGIERDEASFTALIVLRSISGVEDPNAVTTIMRMINNRASHQSMSPQLSPQEERILQ